MFAMWRTSAVLTAALCLAHIHTHTGRTVLAGDVIFSDSLLAAIRLNTPCVCLTESVSSVGHWWVYVCYFPPLECMLSLSFLLTTVSCHPFESCVCFRQSQGCLKRVLMLNKITVYWYAFTVLFKLPLFHYTPNIHPHLPLLSLNSSHLFLSFPISFLLATFLLPLISLLSLSPFRDQR